MRLCAVEAGIYSSSVVLPETKNNTQTINILVVLIRYLSRRWGRGGVCVKNCGGASVKFIEKLIPKTTAPRIPLRERYACARRVRLGSNAEGRVDSCGWKGFNLDPEKKSARLLFSSIGLLQPTLYIR